MKRAAVLLLLCACTGVSPLVITGESLALTGQTYADTAAAMNVGLDEHKVTVDQYRTWADFARKFKPSYAAARNLWNVARFTKDEALEREVAVTLVRLAAELAGFQLLPATVSRVEPVAPPPAVEVH